MSSGCKKPKKCFAKWLNCINNQKQELDIQGQSPGFDADFDYEEIFSYGDILVLVIFQFWWHFSFGDISVLVTF